MTTAIRSCGKMLCDILDNLKFDLGHILKWFKVNSLKTNPGKCQFMILRTNTDIKVNLFLDRDKFGKSPDVVVNGTTIDDKISFKTHIENIAEQQKKNCTRYDA